MIQFDKTFTTDKVLVRPMLTSDFNEMFALTQDEEMWRFFPGDLSNENELKSWISRGVDETERKTRLAFTVIDQNTNCIIGATSFGNISTKDKRVEIGWTWLTKSSRGTGINSHVKQLLLSYCFDELSMERVELKTDVLNIPARKAMLKIGLIEEGTLRSHTLMNHGRRRDTIFYSLLREEWKSMGK